LKIDDDDQNFGAMAAQKAVQVLEYDDQISNENPGYPQMAKPKSALQYLSHQKPQKSAARRKI